MDSHVSTKIAGVIVTWNKLEQVCLLLQDIKKLDLTRIKLDICIVDNDSSDGTQVYLEENFSAEVTVLQTHKNLGGSGGFSYGLKFVSQQDYDYIWLLDNDVRLDSFALSSLVETLNHNPEIGLVGSQIRKLQEPQKIQELGSFINPRKAHLTINYGDRAVAFVEETLQECPYLLVDACAAASLLVRRAVVQHMGEFEDYFLHFDDVEWCLRAQQNNWKVAVNPSSIIWHHSPDFKYRPWINYYDERNLCHCWQKHYPELVAKRVLVSFPRLVFYAATGRYFLAEAAIAGFQDFINQVYGKREKSFNYPIFSLEDIFSQVNPSGQSIKLLVQAEALKSELCNSWVHPFREKETITLWQPASNWVRQLFQWIAAWVHKPVDVALITCRHPNLYAFHLSRRVYYLTDQGYVPARSHPLALLHAVTQTIQQMGKIYQQIGKVQASQRAEINRAYFSSLVSIIICTTDRPTFLERAVRSLEHSHYKHFEVIIVDASSTTDTNDLLQRLSQEVNFSIQWVKVEPKNVSYSRNIGTRKASGSIIAFFDDDAIPPPGWLEALLHSYARYGAKCAGVGGMVRDATHPEQPLQFRRGISNLLSETIAIRPDDAANYNEIDGFWFNGLMGTNSSFRKDALDAVNGYDEFFDYFLDETDICLRLIQAGYEVHYANTAVDHYPQPSHNRVDQKHLTCWHSLAKNTTYFALKHGFQKLPFPILVIRLISLLIYRCLLRILRLKFTHRLPLTTLIHYIRQAVEGIQIGWQAGINLHRTNAQGKEKVCREACKTL